ncbi:coiled-coil domain-containing protein 153 [Latimeria chalumnae]|uniref:Dynein regulatory complex protein 12 n=1 Tax=Latimeria chalumnae TaxID=7897 RepID=M3XGY5_LATCH|nr:PREDICTED: coiled-coil domain-containing protein 153 [Latimeria chalumnae]XP_014350708.1 PREDICTED: coiled-coil domain-containing protein 153 [Latimeria chalumnae]|eukprot:XP_005988196.1 PREDICTED: coiled-coil domain-containing protein 153 [Latimeria chalumnae]
MPPKKRAKGKKKKGKKKPVDDNAVEEKYKKASLEVEVLKDHLALRRNMCREAQACKEGLKLKLLTLERDLEDERDDKMVINADMTRQYKTMQTDMGIQVHQLEIEVSRLRQQLATCQQELQTTCEEKAWIVKEKDEMIIELQGKIDNMETEYEKILHESLDTLLAKLETAKFRWNDQATALHFQYKQKLLDFGLNPLDI